jgi:hypothetical protein
MSKYLTTRIPRSKVFALIDTAPRLASFFLNEAHDDPTQAIQLARIHVSGARTENVLLVLARRVVGKTAQQAVIAAIGSALLRAPAN